MTMTGHHTRRWFIAGLLAVLVVAPVALEALSDPAASPGMSS